MGIFSKQQYTKRGFTVVELIVVITVIGILAGIVLVAYPNYQRGVRNNERKNDLSQLAAALNTYAVQKNSYISESSGCGFLGAGNGWATQSDGNWYPKSITKCLEEAGLLTSADDILDPSGCRLDQGSNCGAYQTSPTTAYMKAICTKGGKTVVYVMAHLEGEPRKDAEIDALCDPGTLPWFNTGSQKWGTGYGMNYYIVVK